MVVVTAIVRMAIMVVVGLLYFIGLFLVGLIGVLVVLLGL